MQKFLSSIKSKIVNLKKVPEPEVKQNLREGVVSFTCDKCFHQIEENFASRYSCSECVGFDLCLECHKDEVAYYDNKSKPGSNSRTLPADYQPPTHSDTAPLPHFMTPEKKNQYLLIYELQGETVFESIKKSFEFFKERRCMGWRKKVEVSEKYPLGLGDFEWITYAQFHKMTLQVANTFSYYIKPKDLISIYMDNCLEWYLSDFAGLWTSMTTVPLHHTSNLTNLYQILTNSETSLLVCSEQTSPNIIELFKDKEKSETLIKFMKLIVVKASPEFKIEEFASNIPNTIKCLTFKSVFEFGEKNQPNFEFKPREKTDISCISYTSGSTGTPKGVVHLEKYFNNQLIRSFVKYPTCILSFATLAHSQRLSDWKYLYQGARVGIYSGNYEYLFDDLKTIRPHSAWGVPRVWCLIHSQYKSNLQDALDKNALLETPEPEDILRARIMSEISQIFGNRLRTIVTGGAPTPPEVLDFMYKCFHNTMISNSYGLTEAIGIMVDGYISDDVQFRLEPVPEFGYSPNDKPNPRGELVVKTESMSSGYYKNQELTNASFDDGWFRTGDVVELIGNRKIKIIDRKKNAFKLSNGEFVTPEPLENIYVTSIYISQIFIYGDFTKQFLVGVVVPSTILIKKIKADKQIPEDQEYDIVNCQQAKVLILNSIHAIAKEKNLPFCEIPKVISLDDTVWSAENQLITGSGKYSRNHLSSYYKDKIAMMYDSIEKFQINLRKDDQSNVVENYIKSILNITDTSQIDMDGFSFSQIGGDSLGAVKLSNLLKENQNVEISPSVILNQKLNLKSLSKFVENNSISNTNNNNNISQQQEIKDLIQIKWSDELKLSDDIIPNTEEFKSKLKIEKKAGNNIFLTGVTGFLGTNILYSLLDSTEFAGKIYCLMRNIKTKQQGFEEIKNIFKIHGLKYPLERLEESFIPVLGDLSKENIGINEDVLKELEEDIDIIIHNGAIVNMVLPYQNMKSINVESTKFLLSLSNKGSRGVKKFVYISTIGIFANPQLSIINELTVPSTEYIDYSTGYSQSKLVSDVLVREAASRGLPVMIFRPGTIYCHSKTGFDNQIDFIGLILKSILLTKTYPKLLSDQGGKLNLSPVDWVSNSIVDLISHQDFWKKDNPQIFHMVNENSLNLAKLCEYINEIYPISPLSFYEWRDNQFNLTNRFLEPIKHLLERSNRFPGFDNFTCPRTKQHLNIIGKSECQRITKEIVTKNINHLLNQIK